MGGRIEGVNGRREEDRRWREGGAEEDGKWETKGEVRSKYAVQVE